MDGNREPMRLAVVQNPGPIGIAVLAELNIVEKHKHIRLGDLGEIAQPGKIIGLMDRDDQSASSITT